jgi:L-ribulokinase
VGRAYLIGLDYGTESARGVLIDAASGKQMGRHTRAYRHGVMSRTLPNGTELPRGWALQVAADYLEAAEEILSALGRDRVIEAIGIGFTASSPLPATKSGTALSELYPGERHAYVKLWKHGAAQEYAQAISRKGGAFLANFGGKVSGEWLLAKAAQIAAEAPQIWAQTERFIEAGDWLVWQLTGNEAGGLGLAAYKAQYSTAEGYPEGIVPGLAGKLPVPLRVGSAGGTLRDAWRRRTGIVGPAIVAIAVIDSHVVLPAVGGISSGSFVAALGTSAVYLYLSEEYRPLPSGIEGVAWDGSIRDLWCYEAGQASFGDTLAWFVKAFPRADDIGASFRLYNADAAERKPGANHLLALDWWNGNRVPLADSGLSGMLVGLTAETTAVDIYRALIEALCFGARTVLDLFEAGGLGIKRIILTSGLAQNNPLLVQIMADVFGRSVEVPDIDNATAVGAAIHGAVAAKIVAGFAQGSAAYGARTFTLYEPRPRSAAAYRALYQNYRNLCADAAVRTAMHDLNRVASVSSNQSGTESERG